MEQYIVSARKYRPQNFESVIGQNSLTTTLKGAIETNHLAHAYLFCGPRGVGKTTCARIFAKTINCFHPKENGEACDECDSCISFNEQRSMNIIELDAASNNGVDNMRSFIEKVQIPPQMGKYKVFIIDEVHMLSTDAFNAFLKTLEEPPAHAIFILATTEKHKIIPTILSRCQIYEFSRITINDIVSNLKQIAEKEGITADEDSLNVIAQKADGAMRDALSIFDQVVNFCGGNITYDKTIQNLNVLDYDYYFKIVDALLEGKVKDTLLIFDKILSKGFEGQYFVDGLASHIRDLMVSKDEETIKLLEVSKNIEARYKEQSAKCTLPWLYKALELANDCDMNYRNSRNKRLLVEVMFIRIANLADGGIELKKDKPELPLIAVAASPAVANTNIATANNINTQKTSTSTPSRKINTININTGIIRDDDDKTNDTANKPNDNNISIAIDNNLPEEEKNILSAINNFIANNNINTIAENIFIKFTPFIEGNKIKFRLFNSIQLNEIENIKIPLEAFVNKQLSRTDIKVEAYIDEETLNSNKAYTKEEKFVELMNKNPYVKEFQKLFDLYL